MKRIMITRKQLREVVEAQKTNVMFDGQTPSEMGVNAQEKYDDALRAGIRPDAIQLNGKSNNNNVTDNNETVVGIDATDTNSISRSVEQGVNNAIQNGADINKIKIESNPEDILNGTNESIRKFNKKKIEEARLENLRMNSVLMTKKDLRESFINEAITKYYVVDDGGAYNVFSSDDFDAQGKYYENPEYNLKDFEIIRTFTDMVRAFDYAEMLNDTL